jgi:hypothetical protein
MVLNRRIVVIVVVRRVVVGIQARTIHIRQVQNGRTNRHNLKHILLSCSFQIVSLRLFVVFKESNCVKSMYVETRNYRKRTGAMKYRTSIFPKFAPTPLYFQKKNTKHTHHRRWSRCGGDDGRRRHTRKDLPY